MAHNNHFTFRLILAGIVATLLFANIHHKMKAEPSCSSCVQDEMDIELDEVLNSEYKEDFDNDDSEEQEDEESDDENLENDDMNKYEHDDENEEDEGEEE